MSSRGGKYFTPDDRDDQAVFSADKSHLHQDIVKADISTSMKGLARTKQKYLEDVRQPFYSTDRPEVSQGNANRTRAAQRSTNRPRTAQEGTNRPGTALEGTNRPGIALEGTNRPGTAQEGTNRPGTVQEGTNRPGTAQEGTNRPRTAHEGTNRPRTTQEGTNRPHSNSERYSHINDVEKGNTARYGTAEQDLSRGSTGTTVFRTEDRSVFASSIKAPANLIKTDEKHDTGSPQMKAAKARGKAEGVKRAIGQKIEAMVSCGDVNGDVTERANMEARKYGYKSGKYAAIGGLSIGRGAVRLGIYKKQLSAATKDGMISKKAANKLIVDRAKAGIVGAEKSVLSVIKTETVAGLEGFHGSDDIGMQAMTKPKDIYVGAKRSLSMAKHAEKAVKKGFTTTKNAIQNVKKGVQHIRRGANIVKKKLLSNPLVIKSIAIIAVIVVVVSFIAAIASSILGIIPSFSLKSEDQEISDTYLYITQLDAELTETIMMEDTKAHVPPIDVYGYFLNGSEVPKSGMQVYTNADLILAYLDSKYEDYALDGILNSIFGTTVKGEVRDLHSALHQISVNYWVEEVEAETTGDDGSTQTEVTYIYHMDIRLTTQSWEDYYEANKETLLDEGQQEQYAALQEVGVYTFRQQLSSPFVGVDWLTGVSSRWGWRISPISGKKEKHLGLDIAMPGGTPINACNTGTVTAAYHNSYGNYIKVVAPNGDYTLYAHMSGFAVATGDTVVAGDVIGYVGTTGDSTGNHLHLEYHKDGKNLNPLIFAECEKGDS